MVGGREPSKYLLSVRDYVYANFEINVIEIISLNKTANYCGTLNQ